MVKSSTFTGNTMWVQRAQKKQLATGANAQKKKKATPNIVQTPHGRTFRVMDVKGGGRCGLLALYATKNVAQGTPYDKVSSQVFPDNGEGEISAELEDTVQSIRDAVAQVPDSDLGDLRDGEESRDLEHVLKDTFHEIETKNMFRSVVLMADGYVDPLAMRLAARHLEMDGLRVVRLLGGVLVPADYHESKELPDTDVPLVWYDGHGHFKALIPWTSEAAVDAPTAVQPEAAVNDCGVVSNTDGALEAGDRGDEWHVVGAHGRATPADEVQDANLLQHVCENPFSALHVEDDEEDDAAYVVGAGEVTSVAEDAVAHDGDAGQRSTFRNRSGRRMAGRRVAQPSSRGGQGGSKYLKRCPARRTTVQRKCGRERGQEGHGVAWSGVVRGGAHSWERKAREVAPAFGDAIPSASAPSGPSSTGSASSVPGEEKGGGSGEDTPGDRDAMDVSEGSEAPLPRGVGRLDGKCKGEGCDNVATWHYRCGPVEYCVKHYPWKSEGWAQKVEGRRRGKVPAKFQDYTEAPEDKGKPTTESAPKPKRSRVDGASNTKQRRGEGASTVKKQKAAPPVSASSAPSSTDSAESTLSSREDEDESEATDSAESTLSSRGDEDESEASEQQAAPAFGGAISPVPASSAPSSTDSADSTPPSPDNEYEPEPSEQMAAPAFGGAIPSVSVPGAPSGNGKGEKRKRKGKGEKRKRKGKGLEPVVTPPSASEGGTGETTRQYSDRDGNGQSTVGRNLTTSWAESVRLDMEKLRALAKEQVEDYEGTYDKADGRKQDAMTFMVLQQLLVDGLTGDGEGQLEIVPDKVFFRKDKLGSLEAWYNANAKYDPTIIGVVLDKTWAKVDGVVYTVRSVNDGFYRLGDSDGDSDSDLHIEQWKLLESLCDEDGGALTSSVTLEEDQRKFILSLIDMHEIIWRSFIPYLAKGQTPSLYVKEIGTKGMCEDWSKRRLSDKEQGRLESVAEMRRLSKLAFLDASVSDIFHTLPIKATRKGDAAEASFLRDFTSRKGSLCSLNGLAWVREPDELLDEMDRTIMVDTSPRHGSSGAHINHAVKLLQYTYRLNRPISLHEAYLPICAGEREVLQAHFSCWNDNEEVFDDFVARPFLVNVVPGNTTIAMRLSMGRCDRVITDLPPAVIQVLSRDDNVHGTTTDRTNNTGVYTKIAKAGRVIKFVMEQDESLSQQQREETNEGLDRIFSQTRSLIRKRKNDANDEDARNSGRRGASKKVRQGKAPFIGFTLKECLAQLERMFEGLYINGMKLVLEAIEKIDSKCMGSDGWLYEILRAAEVASTDLKKSSVESVDTKGRLQGDASHKAKIDLVVEGLKAEGIGREHFELASTATAVRDVFSSHPLRNQGFRFRRRATLSVNGRRVSRNPGMMVVGLPGRSKVSGRGGNVFAHEHVIDRDCGYWYAVTEVIGDAFFRSYDDHQDDLSDYIGPRDKEGKRIAAKRFNDVLREIGRAYLGVENLTLNQMRTACGTLVMHACTALGISMDHPAVKDFADSIVSSVKTMQKAYDIHRAVARQSRRTELHYKGVVDFSGGAYGILKAAVERELAMERSAERTGTGSIPPDIAEERRQLAKEREEMKEFELKLKKFEQVLVEREALQSQAASGSATGETGDHDAGVGKNCALQPTEHERALKEKTGGARQSQAAGGSSSGGETSDHDTGVGEKRAAEQDSKSNAKRARRGKKIDDRERDGMLAVLTAIKAALARAKEKASGNGADKKKYAGILHHMSQPKFRDMKGHYGTVKFLLKNDEEFNPGPWYMKSEFGTAPPNVNKQKSFVGLRNRLIKYDAENDVADKFVWKWWSP